MSLRLGDSARKSARQWFSIAVLPMLVFDCVCARLLGFRLPLFSTRFFVRGWDTASAAVHRQLGGRAPDLHLLDLSKSSAFTVERCTRFLFRTLSRCWKTRVTFLRWGLLVVKPMSSIPRRSVWRAPDIFVPHRSLVNRGIYCSCFETAEVLLRDSQRTSAMGLICATPEDMTTWREGLRHLCGARQLGRTSPSTRFFSTGEDVVGALCWLVWLFCGSRGGSV